MKYEQAVYVVDDDASVRDSVCALVESMGMTARAYESAEEFLASDGPGLPGCVVTDLRMRGMNGIELLEQLSRENRVMPVIIITGHASVPITVRAMRKGAVTLLEKAYNNQTLWDAIREGLKKDELERDLLARQTEALNRLNCLTLAEREVVDLVVEGKSNKVIAKQLGVSVRTVENRRHRIFVKTKTESVPELVRLVDATRR